MNYARNEQRAVGPARRPDLPRAGRATPASRSVIARQTRRASLQEGWVIANHILVSFHVAFISSVLALPSISILKHEVLRFIFLSTETLISALFMYVSFHFGIALHEMGHFVTAARLNALNDGAQREADRAFKSPRFKRVLFIARLIALAPYGKATGIKREGLNYYPDAPYNLAVAAAGPRASRRVALITLPVAAVLIIVGLTLPAIAAIYAGRLLLGLGVVGLLDFLLADRGKYAEFKEREQRARRKADALAKRSAWWEAAPAARRKLLAGRTQEITHPDLGSVTAPWQFRNCGMGGRHTEKEYPESNISMQEAMFLILSARDYQEAQEMTVRLQTRLKEIIEKEEGCRVMGIGLEGGIAPYIERAGYPLPEVRLWAMMTQAIGECGLRAGEDVAIALDPAMSELEIAYRKHFNVPDSVGMYLFWRDKALTVLDRDGVLEIYTRAMREFDIPLLSIEDGFSEDDHEGWKKVIEALGNRVLVIGDDLVTTNDQTIEMAAGEGLINTALIKANQIGSLYETLLAMLDALGKGLELVVSHRSKSPNDDMEAHIALAVNALGLKCGGGANTERLVKYHAVTELMGKGGHVGTRHALDKNQRAVVASLYAYEEPTNAGIPTVGATAEFVLPDAGVGLKFRGATPLGTSAGTGEAIHLIDSVIEHAEHHEVIDRSAALFEEVEPGVYKFKKNISEAQIHSSEDDALEGLFTRTQRYEGKGCLNAVDNVRNIIAPALRGRNLAAMTLKDIDRSLLLLELREARRRGKLDDDAAHDVRVRVMQRKQNLGMNAVLSVSLAMARALAHIRGKELFELLREEMFDIIDQLADAHNVHVSGSGLADYIAALRKVNAAVESEGRPLFEVLRETTGVYKDAESGPDVLEPPEPIALEVPTPPAALEVMRAFTSGLDSTLTRDAQHALGRTESVLRQAAMVAEEVGVTDRLDWRVLTAAICLKHLPADGMRHARDNRQRVKETSPRVGILSDAELARAEAILHPRADGSLPGSTPEGSADLEAQVLHDAAQLDAFGVEGVYRCIADDTAQGIAPGNVLATAESRYRNLAFDATRKLAGADYAYFESFFKKQRQEASAGATPWGAIGVANWIRNHASAPPSEMAGEALAAMDTEEKCPDTRYAQAFFQALGTAYSERESLVMLPARESLQPGPPASVLTETEDRRIAEVNEELYHAYMGEEDSRARQQALHGYMDAKHVVARRTGRFGVVNNRIYRCGGQLIVPYLVGDALVVHRVTQECTRAEAAHPLAPGTILTDDLVRKLAGIEGTCIDLEKELFDFGTERAKPIRITRIQDMAAQLKSINESANRNEAVYVLRCLVARLCILSFRARLEAKNLPTEVHNLLTELTRFLNMPLSSRLPFLVRILLRNVAAVVLRPKLIDRLWNDTIDLAEVHVRGSTIVNELRRSSHHAIGKRTLELSRAYLEYLNSGDLQGLTRLGYPTPAPADEEARTRRHPREIVARVTADLEELLGASETMARLRDWQTEFATVLTRCEFGNSLSEEVDEAVTGGIRAQNRWVYYRHLRIIKKRVAEFPRLPSGPAIGLRLDALLTLKPDEPDFDVDCTESELRRIVEDFTAEVRSTYQAALLGALNDVMDAYDRKAYYESFTAICQLRKRLRSSLHEHAFPEQRLVLYQLDCLLEELSYLALRHIASAYDENGVQIRQCLEVIWACVQNLTHDGLYSRELVDLAAMLRDATKTYGEIANVLENVQRNYHKILQRVIVPLERMREQLGFEEEQLRTALANMQRYLHDLNSMAHFCDIARSHIRDQVRDLSRRIDNQPAAPIAEDAAWDILHLSHRDEIKRRVENHETSGNLRERFGAKGSGLIYISHLNIATRDGFILPTTLPRYVPSSGHEARLQGEIAEHLSILEDDIARRDGVRKRFGDPARPLLLAVRGGSVFSMPGILSTVVFVGINDEIAETLAGEDPWHAYDSYRRFLASYSRAVWNVDIEAYNLVDDTKRRYGVTYKYDLPWEGMREVAENTKTILRQKGLGELLDELLADPQKQLLTAINAILDSWGSETARRYREVKDICHAWHTAVIVQEMASGNHRNDQIRVGMDETRASLTGVIPKTRVNDLGVHICVGEFKFSAAGDDLVGGVTKSGSFWPIDELASHMPMLDRRLKHVVAKLRRFMGTDQEVEFTVERGVLSILQARGAEAAADEPGAAFQDPSMEATRGIGIRGGAFRGLVAFDEDDWTELAAEDFGVRDEVDGVLMVMENATPENIPLILSAGGLLTAKGGSTSHAAVAINGIEDKDYTAVMSAAGLQVNVRKHEAVIVDSEGHVRHRIRKGDVLSIHGITGKVYVGSRPVIQGT